MFTISTIHRSLCAGILLFLLVFPGSGILYGQTVQSDEVYRKDLKNRLGILNKYNSSTNKLRTTGSKKVSLSHVSNLQEDIKRVKSIDENMYNSLLQKSRVAYMNLMKDKVVVPSNKLYVRLINPWQDFKSDLIDLNDSQKVNGIRINNIINGQQYAAFSVCNFNDAIQNIKLSIRNTAAMSQIRFYDAQFILSRNYKNVPDALMPVTSSIKIDPGQVKVFLVAVDAKKAGEESNNIQITSKLGTVSIPLYIKNHGIIINTNDMELNTINWAYYSYPMLKDRKADATANLRAHYINTIVIPINNLPQLQKPAVTKEFDAYIDQCKAYDNIILGLDLRRQSKTKEYLSASWKTMFTTWYSFILNRFKQKNINISKKKIYLYLIDEPKPNEIPYLIAFTKWIKTADPSVKLYASINNNQCTDALLPLVDVAQLYNKSLLNLNIKSDKMNKIWIYDTKNKSLAPYQSFRLMAWEAFFKDYGGIGFWNYADIAKGPAGRQSAWNDFDGGYADYNLIYDSNGKIINSRRWEAFRAGIEDYYLLKLYAKKFGVSAAKQYCRQVLIGSGNINLADSIRNILLQKLSAK